MVKLLHLVKENIYIEQFRTVSSLNSLLCKSPLLCILVVPGDTPSGMDRFHLISFHLHLLRSPLALADEIKMIKQKQNLVLFSVRPLYGAIEAQSSRGSIRCEGSFASAQIE